MAGRTKLLEIRTRAPARMVGADPARRRFRAIVILTTHGTAGHAAQDGDLPATAESFGILRIDNNS